MDSEDEELDLALITSEVVSSLALSVLAYGARFDKLAKHTYMLSGQHWIDDLFAGHDDRFYNEFGLRKHVFRQLLVVLDQDAGLHGTRHVSASEQLCMFLHYSRRALSNRALQERFQRSGDTVMKCIHRVLDALTSEVVYRDYVKLPTHETPVHPFIRQSKQFFPYFKDCLGALDGTHIPAHVPEAKHLTYRNRKGNLSQNVLAACDIGLNFVYVLAGWEGSACDSRVFENACILDFKIPEGRYFLADAGYASSDALLVPYRGVRYHLKEWGQVGTRPQNYKELFNLRHAQLRCCIERIFGIAKRRFKVLLAAQEYSLQTQAQLVSALSVLHNFIRIHDPSDITYEVEDVQGDMDEPERGDAAQDERHRVNDRREKIAQLMWTDYRHSGYHRRQ